MTKRREVGYDKEGRESDGEEWSGKGMTKRGVAVGMTGKEIGD